MKGEIEKKNKFNKRLKKQKISKEWLPNWKKKAYHKLGLKNEIEKKSTFYKGSRT